MNLISEAKVDTLYALTTFLSTGIHKEVLPNYEDLRFRLAVLLAPLNKSGNYQKILSEWKPDFDLKGHLDNHRVWNGLSAYGTPILIEAI